MSLSSGKACQTFSGSWGYRDETTWKNPGQLIRMLVNLPLPAAGIY